MTTKPRLFITQELRKNLEFFLPDAQAHYLCHVLRMAAGSSFLAFDGKTGEFECELSACGKKQAAAKVLRQTRNFEKAPDIHLLFAPVKKDKTDFIVEKSTELGVSKIVPVITRRTISEKIKKERYIAQAVEAAEQCRRLDVPDVADAQNLEAALKEWDENRILYYMDETGQGRPVAEVFAEDTGKHQAAAVLVGPEGGFDEAELGFLRKQKYAKGVSLGKRILRAETAVVAALSCWQAICGDWE